jgi:hypothetical protein
MNKCLNMNFSYLLSFLTLVLRECLLELVHKLLKRIKHLCFDVISVMRYPDSLPVSRT